MLENSIIIIIILIIIIIIIILINIIIVILVSVSLSYWTAVILLLTVCFFYEQGDSKSCGLILMKFSVTATL